MFYVLFEIAASAKQGEKLKIKSKYTNPNSKQKTVFGIQIFCTFKNMKIFLM